MNLGPLYACSQVLVNSLPIPSRVFDFGANEGGVAEHFAGLGSVVHAYEPVPVMYDRLVRVAGRQSSVIPHRLAVSNLPGQLRNVNVFNAWTLLPNDTERDKAVEFKESPGFDCDVTTLDLEVVKYGDPDFIKIDVDGFEFRVLQGGLNFLTRKRPPIQFEYSYLPTFLGDSVEEMARLIYGLGYQAWSMDGSYRSPTADDFLDNFPEGSSYDVMLLSGG